MAVEQTPKTDDAARAKARERMAAYRKTPEYQDWLQRSRELRRGLKEKYRRQAGAKPRDAQAAAEKREQEAAARRLRDGVRGLHDAHVKRFDFLRRERASFAKRYANDPQAERERSAARKLALREGYVRQLLRNMGITNDEIAPEMIELKREAMLFKRLARQIRKAIANHNEENHEAITEHA